MKRIGVISDTHGRLDPRAAELLQGVDLIVHAGDIGGPDIMEALERIAPVEAVLGNNDPAIYGPNVGRYNKFEVEGVRFLVAHRPNDVAISTFGSSAVAPGDPIPDVRIYGHTHVPALETGSAASPSDVLMNPGALFRARSQTGKTIAFIDVDDYMVKSVRIVSLDGDTLFKS